MKSELEKHTQTEEPQSIIDKLWEKFVSGKPGHVKNILTEKSRLGCQDAARLENKPFDHDHSGTYASARRSCIKHVLEIEQDCKRNNRRYTDRDFDMDIDHCVYGLGVPTVPEPKKDKSDDEKKDNDRKGSKVVSFAQRRRHVGTHGTHVHRHGTDVDDCENCDRPDRPETQHGVAEIFKKPKFAPGAAKSNLNALRRELAVAGGTSGRWRWRAALVVLAFIMLPVAHYVYTLDTWTLFSLTTLIAGSVVVFYWLLLRPSRLHFSECEIRQGNVGNCWFISALGSLSVNGELLSKVCIAWDQKYGIYGFCFFRDGAWTYTVVDDRLFVRVPDYDQFWDPGNSTKDRFDKRAEAYRAALQTGSDALSFADCGEGDFTWLPLLEKAYAKVHGDYEALNGGETSEGIEDLTGGIPQIIATSHVVNKDQLWKDLRRCKGQLIYGLGSPFEGYDWGLGLTLGHAYSIEGFCTYPSFTWRPKMVRLVKISNPWGRREGTWQREWSIGNKTWTPFALWWLRPSLQRSGTFYMTWEDMLATFEEIDHVTVLDESQWTMKQRWVKLDVSWTSTYNNVYFQLHLAKPSHVHLCLSRLDHRYFCALEGRHIFMLEFILKKQDSIDHIGRAFNVLDDVKRRFPRRSVTLETELEAGIYEVLVKITALQNPYYETLAWSVEDVVKQRLQRPKKLQQIARNYDEAWSKLEIVEDPAAKKEEDKGKKSKKKKKSKSKSKDGDKGSDEKKKQSKDSDKSSDGEKKQSDVSKVDKGTQTDDDKAKKDNSSSSDKSEQTEDEQAKSSEKDKKQSDDSKVDKGTQTDDEKADKDNSSNSDDVEQSGEGKSKDDKTAEDKSKDGKSAEDKSSNSEHARTPEDEKSKQSKDKKQDDDSDNSSDSDDDDSDDDKEVYTVHLGRNYVTWNAVCGVGLRAYSKDPDMRLELRHRNEEIQQTTTEGS